MNAVWKRTAITANGNCLRLFSSILTAAVFGRRFYNNSALQRARERVSGMNDQKHVTFDPRLYAAWRNLAAAIVNASDDADTVQLCGDPKEG